MFDAAGAEQRPRRIVRRIIDALMDRIVSDPPLTIRFPDGTQTRYGGPGEALSLAITTWDAARRIVADPALAFGEAFVDGTLVPLNCTVFDLLDLLLSARVRGGLGAIATFRDGLSRLGKRLAQFNPSGRAQRNVAHHYDLDNRLYRLLLDPDLQYSCAYFRHGGETLEQAQADKKRLVAAKLLLRRPGLRVLDIGSGWGGMALTLARDYGADVTGITLSQEQLAVSRARAAEAGLSDRVRFELMDYRSIPLTFDRIVSIGMFEHVGVNHYRQFFDVVRRCLEPDGVALVHAIGRSRGPEATNSWLKKYIFPGGYAPALSEVMPAAEKSGLVATDIEILRLHYAETLAHWRANLQLHRETITATHDERFMRMFEFYLSGSELAFRRSAYMVWQLQLARDQAAVPLTRDYLTA